MAHSLYKSIFIATALLVVVIRGNSQATLPEELTNGTIKEQINYLEERTRIYENYRAIREDMFQKINRNILDTLSKDKKRITGLMEVTSSLNRSTDSLNNIIEKTMNNLGEVTRTKNLIKVLGMEVNKIAYNTIMWTIVIALVVFLAIGFLVFKRYMILNIKTSKELKELKDEFEVYRQNTRIAREKMTMDHFNEIKRLKGT